MMSAPAEKADPTEPRSAAPKTLLDRVFAVGVVIKGIDGALELLAGLALLLAPGALDQLLRYLLGEAREGHSELTRAIATLIAHTDAQLLAGSTVFLIAFLLAHGVIKLVLVFCLLRRIVRAYPWAIAVLAIFLGYQVYALIASPSVSLALFVVLDVVILVLVWREYRELRGSGRAPSSPRRPPSPPRR